MYAILDTTYVATDVWLAVAQGLLEGGAGLLQVRAKKEDADQRRKLVEAVRPVCQRFGVPLIVNDDLELAASLPGVGLHIGQEDTPPEQARLRLGPERILGWSTHTPAQVQSALSLPPDILSYFAVGPVFPTATKPGVAPVGLSLVAEAAQWESRLPEGRRLPWYAIGGIHSGNIGSVKSAGARRVVSVSALLLAGDVAEATRTLRAALG